MSTESAGVTPPLDAFKEHNPEASVETLGEGWVIRKPWGDNSVELHIPSSHAAIGALDYLRLPPRFSALLHRDTRDIEFIASPTPPESELQARRFTFRQGVRSYMCEWAPASDRLVALAEVAQPTVHTGSNSNLRNLGRFGLASVALRIRTGSKKVDKFKLEPWSFWIRAPDVTEEDLVSLARHLNLYMRYFDQDTPIIVVHEEPTEPMSVVETPDPLPGFPTEIAARELDPHLLSLWESAALSSDTFRRFLYHFQILEYAAFYLLRDEAFETIRRALVAPDTPTRVADVARQILDTLVEDRRTDEAKFSAVIARYADPSAIWMEIEPHKEYFSQPVTFDGGFCLPALISPKWDVKDFCSAWMPKLPDTFRKIRNALVHAREARLVNSILPTRANLQKIHPWIPPLARIAMQVMIFRE